MYVSGNTQIKSQILSSIFAEKLVFEAKSYRTLVYHEALALILNTSKGLGGNKKGQTAGNNNLSSLVAPALPTSNQILEDLKTLGDFG